MNSDGTVTVTGAEDTYGYLCKAKDAYGDSYYYRGNVTNNYVLFDGKYWRIIRYNGDGSVRVIYDGTTAHANGESSTDRQIGKSSFNNIQPNSVTLVDDNATIGYMFGVKDSLYEIESSIPAQWNKFSSNYFAKSYIYDSESDKFTLKDPSALKGIQMTSDYVGYYTFNSSDASHSANSIYKITELGNATRFGTEGTYSTLIAITSNKEKAQTNVFSSNIKKYIDTWYENNIKGTAAEKYIVDNILCNDRSFALNNSGTGAGISPTSYRWANFADDSNNNKMMLTCPQQNDAFTVSDTSKGNGALTYSIGLVTNDEVVLGGGWSSKTSDYYLYTGQDYWTSSPIVLSDSGAFVRYVKSNGGADNSNYHISATNGVRPVISLSSEVLEQGDGTMSNPYHAAS